MSEAEKAAAWARQFERAMNAQIASAKAAGCDDTSDLCITVPAGYLALVAGYPLLELDGKLTAVTTIKAAEGMLRVLRAESGWLD